MTRNFIQQILNIPPKGKNTNTAEWPAAFDLNRGNKSVDLFPRIKSQAAGRSAPRRSAVFVFLA
jgi:hypothetical protein